MVDPKSATVCGHVFSGGVGDVATALFLLHCSPAMAERDLYPTHVRALLRSWWIDRIGKSVDVWKAGKLVRGIMVRTITGKGLKVYFETGVTHTVGDYLIFLLNRQRSVYGQLGEYVLKGVTVSMVKERIKDRVGPVEDLKVYGGARVGPLGNSTYIIDIASTRTFHEGEFLVMTSIPVGQARSSRQRELQKDGGIA